MLEVSPLVANITYPHTIYPVILSKTEPLVVRVDELVLLVGTTSYSAKIKMGAMFTGYYIYVSSLGEPIGKIPVSIEGYNSTYTTDISTTDAYRHIMDVARDWVDTLEKSILVDSNEKSVVELLREIKFQQHFDTSGHTANASDYDNLEICTDEPTYIQTIKDSLIDSNAYMFGNLNTSEGIYIPPSESLEGKLEDRLTAIEEKFNEQLTRIADDLDIIKQSMTMDGEKETTLCESISKSASTISKAVEDGLSSMVTQMNNMNTNIATYNAKLGNATDSGTDTLFGLMSNTYRSVGTYDNTYGSVHDKINAQFYSDDDVAGNHSVRQYLKNIVETESTQSAQIKEIHDHPIYGYANSWNDAISKIPTMDSRIYEIWNHPIYSYASNWNTYITNMYNSPLWTWAAEGTGGRIQDISDIWHWVKPD